MPAGEICMIYRCFVILKPSFSSLLSSSLIHQFFFCVPLKTELHYHTVVYTFQTERFLVLVCTVMWMFFFYFRIPVEPEMAPSPSGWRASPAVTKRSLVLAPLFLICR